MNTNRIKNTARSTAAVAAAVLAAGLAHSAPIAEAAGQSYNLNVAVIGGSGTLTGPDGLDCTDNGGVCARLYSERCAYDPEEGELVCEPRTVRLVATAGPGHADPSWGGDCAGATGDTCDVLMSDDRSASVSFRETTPPTIQLVEPQQGTFHTGSIVVTASAADNVAVDRVEFEVGPLTGIDRTPPYQVAVSTSQLAEGAHWVQVTAYDKAGNHKTAPRRHVIVDDSAPEVHVFGPAESSAVEGSTHTWHYWGTDSHSGITRFECSVTAEGASYEWTACSDQPNQAHSASGLAPGVYRFAVRALDKVGHVSAPKTARLEVVPRAEAGAHYERAITARWANGKSLFKGVLTAPGKSTCASGQPVTLARVHGGQTTQMGSATTTPEGKYKIPAKRRKGRYVVRAGVSKQGADTCLGATSPRIRVG